MFSSYTTGSPIKFITSSANLSFVIDFLAYLEVVKALSLICLVKIALTSMLVDPTHESDKWMLYIDLSAIFVLSTAPFAIVLVTTELSAKCVLVIPLVLIMFP